MLNKALKPAQKQPLTTNQAGVPAYGFGPKQALAQLAMTGCLNSTFYSSAEAQLSELLKRCFEVDPDFVAKTALYARKHGYMKDTPALLMAWLASFAGELDEQVFPRVIDNGSMLRNLVGILRSGLVARQSLGSRPKRWVQRWLEQASDETLIKAMVGNDPSLADVIKMVHPRAPSRERNALFACILGKPSDAELLPKALLELERFRLNPNQPVPNVPFQLLTGRPLGKEHWIQIARQASWTMTRMNLNTFMRHGVLEDEPTVRLIARRLADRDQVRRAKAMPYQLLTTYQAALAIPEKIRQALRTATEHAIENVPRIPGSVAVLVDVSGSMESAVTGYRNGATSTTRCVDVAGLMAAAVLHRNGGAMVLPFNDQVRNWRRPTHGGVLETAQALAALLGGGTQCSAPLAALNQMSMAPDTVIMFSDNQSWMDARMGETEYQRQWRVLKQRSPSAKLICVDLQPYTNSQIKDQRDVLNIGGFSDEMFKRIAEFATGNSDGKFWVDQIDAMQL